MKKLILIITLLWGGAALGLWYWNDSRSQRVSYRTVKVQRGDVQATINATGTIEPEEVVDVGAQIAGEIQSFGQDPRDPSKPISSGSAVERGMVLASLDDALLKARVNQEKANVLRAEADVRQAQVKVKQTERELDRQKKLQAKRTGAGSAQDFDNALSNAEAARAALEFNRCAVDLARANLEEASVNLGYATIRSPVKGVIVDRRVNVGQTVVASLNAPSLFLIAKDLSRMQIWASVNETDVGSVRVGQGVRFSVGAFPGESFRGKVAQVRLNASMVQSVVTYTVLIDVDNPGGKLLPYLTARLQFEVDERKGALLVPNAALRWQPPVEDVAPSRRKAYEDARSSRQRTPGLADGASQRSEGTLWVKQGDFVRPVPVKVGLTDGVVTEIQGGGLGEGSEVVVGAIRRDEVDDLSSILPHTKTEKSKSK